MSNLKLTTRLIALCLSATMIPATLTGCGKKAECDISTSHAHLYTNEKGYVRYIEDEHLSYEGYDRSDEYISIEGQEDLYEFMDKKNLLRIEDNLDLILAEQESNQDYIEYRYSYRYLQPIPHFMHTGKSTTVYYTYVPQKRHSWTDDPNHSNLTGEQRLCHYVYTAYKIEKNEKGKYVLIPCEDTDDLTTVMDEYPYITKNHSKIVNIEGIEVDYEDGKEEDLTDEEKERIEEYEEETKSNEDVKKLIKKNLE